MQFKTIISGAPGLGSEFSDKRILGNLMIGNCSGKILKVYREYYNHFFFRGSVLKVKNELYKN